MLKRIRQSGLFKDSAMYTFGALFQRGIAYFLIPIYIDVLSTSQYGEYEFLNTLAFLLSILCSVGLPQVILTEFYRVTDNSRLKFFNNIGLSYLLVAIPFYLLFFLFFAFWGTTIFNVKISTINIFLAFLYSFLIFTQNIYFGALRLTFKSVDFMLMNVLNGLLLGGVNILLVYYCHLGITGILITSCLITGGTSLIGFLKFRRRQTPIWHIQVKEARTLLKIGFPFMLSSVAYWFATFADRWIISINLNSSYLGVYSLAYKFAAVYDALIINPLVGAYTPYLFKKFAEKRFFIPYHIIIPATILLFGVLVFVSEFAISIVAKGDFKQARLLIPYMVMAFAFSFIAQIAACVILYLKKNKQLIFNIIITGIVNIVLNIILIKHFQLKGSAYALLLSYIIWALLTVVQSIVLIRATRKDLLVNRL